MSLIRNILLSMMIAGLFACSSSPRISVFKEGDPQTAERRALLVGRWYGEAQLVSGGTRTWIADRRLNGRYRIEFNVKSNEGRFRQVEIGSWGVSGSVYFTILEGWEKGEYIKLADPADPSIYDAYEILELTESLMRYRSHETGASYTLRRVAADFQLPKDA